MDTGLLIKGLGLGPAALAARLSVTRSYAHDLMDGRRSPGPDLALSIEREFGLNAALLNKTIASVRKAAA